MFFFLFFFSFIFDFIKPENSVKITRKCLRTLVSRRWDMTKCLFWESCTPKIWIMILDYLNRWFDVFFINIGMFSTSIKSHLSREIVQGERIENSKMILQDKRLLLPRRIFHKQHTTNQNVYHYDSQTQQKYRHFPLAEKPYLLFVKRQVKPDLFKEWCIMGERKKSGSLCQYAQAALGSNKGGFA